MTNDGMSAASADDHNPGPRPDRDGLPVLAPDGDGLRWSFELDLVSVLEAMGRPLRDWDGVDQEAELVAEAESLGLLDAPPAPGDVWPSRQEPPAAQPGAAQPGAAQPGAAQPGAAQPAAAQPAAAQPGGPGADISGAVAEALAAGPGLAAWLAGQDPATATGRDLAGMAGAFRRVASWAQARELDLIAHLATRSAAADPKAGLQADGRPAYVTDDAAGQVSLELVLSRTGAEAWTGLAVTLRWKLPATAAALAEGRIDTYRAKILAEAVAPLSDAAARVVEDRVIPRAGELTYGQLHAVVRRAVIAADPEGAEHRRQAAERRAAVRLYPDQDGTATLSGICLPALDAAAAYARICAIAQAMKAAGAGGGIHFLRAQALLGQILQTLPPISPPAGGPPDADPPPADPDDGWTPGPAGEPPAEPGPGPGPGPGSEPRPRPAAPWPDVPPPTDADLPADDGYRSAWPLPGNGSPDGGRSGGYDDWDPRRGDPLDDHFAPAAVQWPWPPIPPRVPAPRGSGAPGTADPTRTADPPRAPDPPGIVEPPGTTDPAGNQSRPPSGGLLDLTVPWVTFTGEAEVPGSLGRIGPITAPQARQAVNLALRDTRTQWRAILTDADGRAIAVARVPRTSAAAGRRDPAGAAGTRTATAAASTPTVGRVTIVMPADALDSAVTPRPGNGIYPRILGAARRARDVAREQAAADQHVPGGCAHTAASPAYQPPPRIREHVAARDQTCRNPRCGQPAWRADLDHTIPFDQGGRTCPCDLGALCRHDHQLKQRPGWTLAQPRPGTFLWTTPAGRTYSTTPDPYFA